MSKEKVYRGTVKFYNQKRGFGFIKRQDNNEDIFFHRSDVEETRYLMQNDKVEFEIVEAGQGKKKAVNVKKIS